MELNDKKRSVALSVLTFVTTATLADEPVDWGKLVSVRANMLSTCAVPVALESRRLKQLPRERLITVYSSAITAMKDGCEFTVYTSEDKQRIYISAGGGLANHIDIYLGPFRSDGSDF